MRFQKKKKKFNVQPILNFKFQTQLVKKKKVQTQLTILLIFEI